MDKFQKLREDAIVLEFFKWEDRNRRMARIKVGALFILFGIILFSVLYITASIEPAVNDFMGL